tara:strand:+ start:475 stop:861 length:387 start_codon:yes stop_codon:yes gene_type:complete
MLDYLRKHVTEWPEDATKVWLDHDGEVRFLPDVVWDFYPPGERISYVRSPEYTREEWEQPTKDLTKLDKPFGELDRATQLRLVEHVLDGGGVERLDPMLNNPLWVYQEGPHKSKLLCFVDRLKYRVKH